MCVCKVVFDDGRGQWVGGMWDREEGRRKGRTLPGSIPTAIAGSPKGGTTREAHWAEATYEAKTENPKVSIWLQVQLCVWNKPQTDKVIWLHSTSVSSSTRYSHILVEGKSRVHSVMLAELDPSTARMRWGCGVDRPTRPLRSVSRTRGIHAR